MRILVLSFGFGLVTASILAIAAVGFTLQFGVTNVLNIAYGDVMSAAAFVAYEVNAAGFNIWVGLLAGAAFGGVFSVLLNRFVLAPFIRRGTSLFRMIVVTIALSLIIQNSLQAIFGPNFFSYKLSATGSHSFAGMVFTDTQLEIMALAVGVMLALHALLRYTRIGKAMRATAGDASLARSCGIPTSRITDLAWLISGVLCGTAGVVLVMNVTTFESTVGEEFLITIIAAATLGGIGQPYGAMLGALILGVASEVIAAYTQPSYKDVVAFVILVAVLLVRPQGLLSEIAIKKEAVA